ncbi:MAG: acyl-CoA dehydrogenase family protein, partial [Myxococcota bacterium]
MTGPIQLLASEDIKRRVLPPIMSGEVGGSLAVTEPGGGSDVANLRTTAKRDGDSWVLNGAKTFITGGMRSKYFLVGARTGASGLMGISLFLVEADTPGFTRTLIDRKMGWWASDTTQLFFEDCRIPAENLVGEVDHGFMAIVNNFNNERFAMVAQMLGFAKTCFEESVKYARDRETFGKPLI